MHSSPHIGIFGGTFDPVHKGHLQMAASAYQTLGLDGVQFVPSYQPVHKHSNTQAQHRADMLSLAIASFPWAEINLLEYQREGKSYTADTVRALQAQSPTTNFYLLIGEDSLYTLTTWYQWQTVLQHVKIAVLPRAATPVELHPEINAVMHTDLAEFKTASQGVFMLPAEPVNISSTALRTQLKQGKTPRKWLPQAVADYIELHHLYRD